MRSISAGVGVGAEHVRASSSAMRALVSASLVVTVGSAPDACRSASAIGAEHVGVAVGDALRR